MSDPHSVDERSRADRVTSGASADALHQEPWVPVCSTRSQQRFSSSPSARSKTGEGRILLSRILWLDKPVGHMKNVRIRVLPSRLILRACEQRSPLGRGTGPEPAEWASIELAVRVVAEDRRRMLAKEAASACGTSGKAFRSRLRALWGIRFPPCSLKYHVDGAALQLLQGKGLIKGIIVDSGFTCMSDLDHASWRFFVCFFLMTKMAWSR